MKAPAATQSSLFGPYIRQLRESRSMTIIESAKLIGISKQRLWDIENGRRMAKRVPRAFAVKIAKVYHTSVDLIIAETRIKLQESRVISEHLAEIRPMAARASKLAVAILAEAQEYSPELEAMARTLCEQLMYVQTRLDTAYRALYPKNPNIKDSEL